MAWNIDDLCNNLVVPFDLGELLKAHKAYQEFLLKDPPKNHARFIFPFFAGSYFTYRKIDVLRTVAIARSFSDNPSYVDFGCGYGDFLKKIRDYIPEAIGVEAETRVYYAMQTQKPGFVLSMPVELFDQRVNVAFVGWMEPGQDFRKHVASCADCVITTYDSGGQCGVNGACEYDEFGLVPIASWRTPSWIDVNAELMNRYYTPGLSIEQKARLASIRTAHNIWQVYARDKTSNAVRDALKHWADKETTSPTERYEFESVLDECGFGYMQKLRGQGDATLWQIRFD